jgi:hypothetical protein
MANGGAADLGGGSREVTFLRDREEIADVA